MAAAVLVVAGTILAMLHPAQVIATFLLLASLSVSAAAQSFPVAVRWWGGRTVSVENWWNLHVVVAETAEAAAAGPLSEADLLLVAGGGAAGGGDVESDIEVRELSGENLWLVLDRPPNQDRSSVLSPIEAVQRSGHECSVRSLGGWLVVIESDGVRLGVVLRPRGEDEPVVPREVIPLDLLAIPLAGEHALTVDAARELIGRAEARLVVPIGGESFAEGAPREALEKLRRALPDGAELASQVGNTSPVTRDRGPTAGAPRVLVLRPEPWQPPRELANLVERLSVAAGEVGRLFAPLTVEQMNFRPPDGTHTPRWNVEHLASTELYFLTNIYSNRTDLIGPIPLFPQQMPEDYQPRHADWTGAEEARRIGRVRSLVDRYLYLLDGVPLDDLPEGAPQFAESLRGVFDVLAGHYREHAAHVRQKMDLPGWPEG